MDENGNRVVKKRVINKDGSETVTETTIGRDGKKVIITRNIAKDGTIEEEETTIGKDGKITKVKRNIAKDGTIEEEHTDANGNVIRVTRKGGVDDKSCQTDVQTLEDVLKSLGIDMEKIK